MKTRLLSISFARLFAVATAILILALPQAYAQVTTNTRANTSGARLSTGNGSATTFTITAIPEPSTWIAIVGMLGLFYWPSRKRIVRDILRLFRTRA